MKIILTLAQGKLIFINIHKITSKQGQNQGCQLSRIECESHAWTLILTLSRQACKISRMNAKHPAKLIKSQVSRKT